MGGEEEPPDTLTTGTGGTEAELIGERVREGP